MGPAHRAVLISAKGRTNISERFGDASRLCAIQIHLYLAYLLTFCGRSTRHSRERGCTSGASRDVFVHSSVSAGAHFAHPGAITKLSYRGWLIKYLDDANATRARERSPIPVLTGLDVEQLRWSRATRCHYSHFPELLQVTSHLLHPTCSLGCGCLEYLRPMCYLFYRPTVSVNSDGAKIEKK